MRGWELPKSGINCDNVDEKSTGGLFEEAKYFGLNNRGRFKIKKSCKGQ